MTDKQGDAASDIYKDNHQHLRDELAWLDSLLRSRVLALRNEIEPPREPGAFPSVYISAREVDGLLGQEKPGLADVPEIREARERLHLMRSEISAKIGRSLEQGVFLALPQLVHLFGLSPFEQAAVIVCLAPELRRKYDRVYAYLQDDITRKRPSIDLILDLLCESESGKWEARALFSEHAPLMRAGVLRKIDDPQSPSGSSGLAQFLELDPRILDFLLGRNRLDARLIDSASVFHPSSVHSLADPAIASRLLRLMRAHFATPPIERKSLMVSLSGRCRLMQQQLALALCAEIGCTLITLDTELLLAHSLGTEAVLRLAFRECLLMGAALCFEKADALLAREDTAHQVRTFQRLAGKNGWLVFLIGERPWKPKDPLETVRFYGLELPMPAEHHRQALWEKGLGERFADPQPWAEQLAERFSLPPGKIGEALECAWNESAMREERQEMSLADIYHACRQVSKQDLGSLAVRVEPKYGWNDLVLPANQVFLLREICSHVTRRYRVFGDWGFDRKLSHGKGLSVLFSGSPGTGKTMAAQVIARELQLDLYRIDLSGVVSKYIGETEKNLAKIFENAESSQAILFFDEADALFGKRTEISDAHDRYANIETSYLLQKIEEYEGMVILATNLRENMDDAFLRRIRFVVEFPFPDEASRLQIWRNHFPEKAPLSETIDYEYLSRELKIAGGNIKNIVLNAAFLAAENGGVIDMEHILHGAKREYEKIGKLWTGKNSHPLNRGNDRNRSDASPLQGKSREGRA